MGWDQLTALLRGVMGVKLGPGVLATIIPIATIGLVALALVGWALSAHPTAALIGIVLILAFLVYACERAFRYAEKNPLPALLGGAEYFQLLRDQMSARDSGIVVDAKPVLGASTVAAKAEEGTDV
jgi:hypothetical protein